MANVNPVNSFNSNIIVEDNFANRMPSTENFTNRNQIFPTNQSQNTNPFQTRYNPVKRYHPKMAFSNGSTADAFLKSRILMGPIFMHNEAKTKYAMISTIDTKTKDINNNMMRII